MPPAHWVAHILALGGLGVVALVVGRWWPWLADTFAAAAWALWCNATTAPLSYALQRRADPLRDDLLVAFDAALRLPVPRLKAALVELLPAHSWWAVYDTLAPLLALTVVLLPVTGRAARARQLLVAYVISFGLAIPLMLALQAEGPWAAHGYAASPEQAGYVRELVALRTPGPFAFDPLRITGVVTFPSFHTILAALAGWAIAPIRWVGPAGAALCVAIGLATVATGWHYVADVVAGVFVAAVAIGAARRLEGRWSN